MPNYRRNYVGTHFFFTLVTRNRRPVFADASARFRLGDAIRQTQQERPWIMQAVVVLPNHLHMVWEMPPEDTDYSTRIAVMKKRFARAHLGSGGSEASVLPGQLRHRLRGVWQRRFMEHTIRDARDYRMHLDYIHLNPVKHGFVERPCDWP
ncbi:MAG TPA: transposase [Phycisphaerae bacterium]|nr:transposase [Phycisphaerae bacterium]